MNEFTDCVQFFINTINYLKRGEISLRSPLEEIALKTCWNKFAYIDDRKATKEKYGYDFWSSFGKDWLKEQRIAKGLLYSASQQFPDFLFKTQKHNDRYVAGSLMELKDSKGGNISSFNSTVPTKYKTLKEIDVINGNDLVSRIAKVFDGKFALDENYFTFQRRCFYLVRTQKNTNKVKVSIVDGSFFETVPKEHLFYQMFLNVLQSHIEKKELKISPETLDKVRETLSHINDQTIIASSQIIEGASVRPRLRIMAEVHPEGNPHSSFYPEITDGSFNLILQSSPKVEEIKEEICSHIPEIDVSFIHHKRNGEHAVFQFGKEKHLNRYT